MLTGVMMPPRATLEPDDLVTPTQAAKLLDVKAGTVRIWIHRSESILGRKIEPLGLVGRWPVYDFNDLAAIDAIMRRRKSTQAFHEAA